MRSLWAVSHPRGIGPAHDVKASLLDIQTREIVHAFTIEEGQRVVIGRSDRADVQVEGEGVSRTHCVLACKEGRIRIHDLGSHNGTWVNGERIEEGTLEPGDTLRLGLLELEFQAETDAMAPAAAVMVAPSPGATPPSFEMEVISDEPAEGPEPVEPVLAEALEPEPSPEPEPMPIAASATPAKASSRGYWTHRRHGSAAANLLWWGVSFVLHVILLVILAQFDFGTLPEKKKRIKIKAELVALTERLQPIRRQVIDLAKLSKPANTSGKPYNELLANTQQLVPMAVIGGVSGADVSALFKSGGGGMFDTMGRGGKVAQVRKAAAQNYDEAIDDFAMEMIDHLDKKDLLLVLLFDQSKSLDNDRQLIMAKIETVTKALDGNLDERKKKRLKWSVVSYGRSHRVLLRPTSDIPQVKAAIGRIKPDPSGEENLIGALQYCLRTFAPLKKPTFIVVVTDEAGTDVDDSKAVELTIRALVAKKFRIYIFGRESVFSCHEATETYEGYRVFVDKGPESVVPEFFGADRVFTTYESVPSGYAMYTQGRLASATGGQCYLLTTQRSPYNFRKLDEMQPELCSASEYKARTAKSTIRSTLQFIVRTWPGKRPTLVPSGGKMAAASAMREAVAAQQWCSQAIRRLKSLRKRRTKASKYAAKRWQANFDLIYAQLHKFRFMLRQYAIAMQKGGLQAPLTDKEGNEFVGFSLRVDKGQSFAKDKELPKVRALFDAIIKEYRGTPWAAVAKIERDSMGAIVTVPRYRRKPSPGGATKPPPKV